MEKRNLARFIPLRTAVQIRLLQLIRSFYAVSARAVYGSSGLNPWEKVDVYPGDCWAVRKTLSYVVQMEIISFIYRGDQPW